jgi:hypothetical protein
MKQYFLCAEQSAHTVVVYRGVKFLLKTLSMRTGQFGLLCDEKYYQSILF